MWRIFSLLFFCCAVSGLDAPEADRSTELSREKMLPTEAAELGKPDKDDPVVGALGKVEQPVAQSLEDELDNQENIISQVSNVTVCALIGLSPNLTNKNLVLRRVCTAAPHSMKYSTYPILVNRKRHILHTKPEIATVFNFKVNYMQFPQLSKNLFDLNLCQVTSEKILTF